MQTVSCQISVLVQTNCRFSAAERQASIPPPPAGFLLCGAFMWPRGPSLHGRVRTRRLPAALQRVQTHQVTVSPELTAGFLRLQTKLCPPQRTGVQRQDPTRPDRVGLDQKDQQTVRFWFMALGWILLVLVGDSWRF